GTIRSCDPNRGDHDAYKFELSVTPSDWTRRLREDALRGHGYVQVLDRGFFSTGNILEQGRTKYGGEIAWKLTAQDQLVLRHDGSIANLPQLQGSFPQPGLGTPMPGADPSGLAQMETELLTLQYSGTRGKLGWKGEYSHQFQQLLGPFVDQSKRLSPALQRDFLALFASYRLKPRWTARVGQEVVLRT